MLRIALFSVPLILFTALIALFALNINRDPDFVPSVLIDKPVPDIALPAISDAVSTPGFDAADFPGQVTVVNVFASWCIPCREEHPFLMELAGRGVIIYGINEKDAPRNAQQFLNDLGNPYDRIGADRDGRAAIEWGVYGVPETFVVNPAGIITYKHVGPLSRRSMDEGLLPAIAAAGAGGSPEAR